MRAYEYRGPIETDRLMLRAFQPGDLDVVHAIRSDPGVVRYLYWDVHTRDEARAVLEQRVAFRGIREEGDVLAVLAVLRSTGEVVADLILRCLSTQHAVGEIGFIVLPAHQGRGYATEAGRAILRIGFDDVGFHRVVGHLDARNAASARVLEKLGMRREGHFVENEWVKGEWQSELVYAILDREWRARQAGHAS
jgi:RimJ/RimL family protein N-acetyltransferase